MKKENTRTGLEIAVIGMAGKFPGAKNIEAFWSNLENGVESLSFFSNEELEKVGGSPGVIKDPHFVKVLGGVFEDIEYFDASFFNYTPMEAEYMAPPIRIFHECLWETMEDAGYDPENLKGLIGLYTGVSSTSNWERLVNLSSSHKNLSHMISYHLSNKDFIGTLASYKLNLQGPVFTMNTACSTSLAAVHLACQGLLSGDCDMALAGGIEITLDEKMGYFYEEGMIESPDGHCRAFEAKAKGTIGGDGVGIAALKRLEDALPDRDNVYAVIKGSAINNDGNRKVGYTAPSVEGQAAVIRNALEIAAVSPEDINYVETHGTATPLGDVTEIEALKIAFNTNKRHFCALGAVKTNVGHLGMAAGITGFIKTVLALKHQLIPPTLHFETSNPRIDFINSPFYVNAKPMQWENGKYPRRAGVSSFGIGGTNAHVILEEWSDDPSSNARRTAPSARRVHHLILLSAKTPSALEKMTENLAEYFKKNLLNHDNHENPINPGPTLADAAYTLQVGRKQFAYRRKFVCSNIPEAVDRLTSGDPRKIQTFRVNEEDENKPVVFMFSGLGSQYVNMGCGLYQSYPLFKKEMDRCFDILNTLRDYDIKETLYPDERKAQGAERKANKRHALCAVRNAINQIEIAQIIVFIFEYALAKLLMSWGILPHAMIGYSFGEYAAACLAGVFSLEDALKLVVVRGKLLQELPPGMMLSVPLPKNDLYPLLMDELSIAIDNGSSCVVSGPRLAVKFFEKQMKEKKWMCMPLESTHAIHSKMIEPILKKFEEAVAKIPLNPPKIPYISTLTANWISVQDATSPQYWAKQLRETVRFSQGIQNLLKEPGTIFLEVGAGQDISALAKREIKDRPGFQVFNLVRQQKKDIPDAYYLLDKIGLLWLNGVSIDWEGYYFRDENHRVSLPVYPFEKLRFWKLVDDLKAGRYAQYKYLEERENREDRLSHCFYVPSWKQTLSPLSLASDSMVNHNRWWLIFLDECGLGAQLVGGLQLAQNPGKIITVTRGEHFSRVSEDQYIINPSKKEDYDSLIDNLFKAEKLPGVIVHLWGLTSDAHLNLQFDRHSFRKYQDTGYYSLLFLVQSLAPHKLAKNLIDIKNPSNSIQIEIVLNNIYTITGEERLCAEKATILGLCKTIPQEYPNVTCRTIDIQIPGPGSDKESKLILHLIAEFNTPAGNLTVAYRGNSRWIQHLEPLKLEHKSEQPKLLRKKGVYLITGGLGNDSFMRSKYLAEILEARLVLSGRSQLPDREYWRQYLANHGENDELSIKIRRILELEQLGAEVLAISADVSNQFEMKKVMQKIDKKFGTLNGVIHAAGFTRIDSSRLLMELGREESEWHFRSKVYGLYVLEKVLEGWDIDFCLVTSSTASIVGGIGVSAYTAANIFMDVFTRRHNKTNPKPWICLNWQGACAEDTVEAFRRVLSLKAVDQLIFSQIDLGDLIREKIELKSINDKINFADNDDKEAALLYPRPTLANPYMAPGNAIEHQLVEIWQNFFGMEKIGISDDLFQLGGDSLKAINILSIVQKELQVTIPIREFFENSTIEWIARYIIGAEKETYLPVAPSEKKEYYVLSPNQRRLYVLHQLDKESIAYNIPLAVVLEGHLDRWKMENTFLRFIQRQEVFRTALQLVDHEPVQKIYHLSELGFSIEYDDISMMENKKKETGNIHHSFLRPFDLSCAPLLRVGLIKENETEHILMIDMHHIIADAASLVVVVKEFMVLYEQGELPSIRVQYKDYSEWQNKEKANNALKKQEAYWLGQFKDRVPVLSLPTDYVRPTSRPARGSSVHFEIDKEKTARLKELGLKEDSTLFMVLLALYNILLAKLSGQEDIVVGTGIEGRRLQDLRNIVGMFVNTLSLRNYPERNKTFRDFLREVKLRVLDAFENQEYQFEDLVSQLVIERDASRNPLFDVMFHLNNIHIPQVDLPGLKLTPYKTEDLAPKFDLCLQGIEMSDQLFFTLEYSPTLFKQETIEIVARYFKEMLSSVIAAPQKELSEIKKISERRKKVIVAQLNKDMRKEAGTKNRGSGTLQDRLYECLDRFKDNIAIEYKNRLVTYGEVDMRSNHIANWIFNKGIKKQTFIGILINDRIEFICTMIGILKTCCVFVPLDTDYPEDRLEMMVRHIDIRFIICDNFNFSRLTVGNFPWYQAQYAPEFIKIQGLLSPQAGDSPLVQYRSGDNIYVYFTSGSTGTPKAFIGKNQSLLNFIQWEIETFNINSDFRVSQLTNPGFDAFLRDVFVPLCTGGVICIPGNKDILLNPGALINWLDQSRIHLIHCIPSLFRLINSNTLTENHFKNLKFVLFSGERINPLDLVQWYETFAERIQFVNLWGTSETTLAKTFYFIHPSDIHRERIPVGKPMKGARVIILDKQMEVCDHLVTGEIYILTPFRTAGYCNAPELNNERFIRNPFNNNSHDFMHKTGDLGRFLPDGNIDLLGRNDRQVKIRGIRVELEEIESLLVRHRQVKEAVAVKREILGGSELLWAYVVLKDSSEVEEPIVEESLVRELENHLAAKLPAYMVPTNIMVMEKIPRTPRGKVDYRGLPDPLTQNRTHNIPPRDEIEKALCSMWSEILKFHPKKISIIHRFFELGGNSLRAMALISKIHKAFNVKFPLAEVFAKVTIEQQAEFIRNAQEHRYAAIKLAEEKEYYPLSSAQKRIYILQQMEPESRTYNMPRTMVLEGEVDKERLEETFMKLIKRQESFRSSFQMLQGVAVQRIYRQVPFAIDYFEAEEEDVHETVNRYIRPFDLSRAPILRVGLIKTAEARQILIVEMHHIISDGTSLALFVKDFMTLYRGEELPPLRIQYKDFSEWKNSKEERESVKNQEEYWLREFEGDIPVLNLPTDYARPAIRKFDGSTIPFDIETEETEKLKALALKEEATLYMVLLAIFNILLSRLSGQEDIVVGTGIEGRRHEDLRHTIGMFVNTLSLRNYPQEGKTFIEFLKEVREKTLKAFENQDYQFEDLVEKVVIKRDSSRNPLFDINFQVENIETPTIGISRLKILPYKYEDRLSKFDITLRALELRESLLFTVEFSTSLFKEKSIQRFMTYFRKIVSSVVSAPEKRLSEIEMISKKEKEELLLQLNEALDNEIKVIHHKQHNTIQDQLNTALNLFKDHISIAYGDSYLTYSELDKRSNYIANWMINKGIKDQTYMGLLVHSRMAFIIAVIGVLKANCVFIPLDPDQPESRLEMMIRSLNLKYIMTDNANVPQMWKPGFIEEHQLEFILMEEGFRSGEGLEQKLWWYRDSDEDTNRPGIKYRGEDQIYIYFTSGTTGIPRAMVGKNRSLYHFIDWEITTFGIKRGYRVSQLTSPGFDAFLRDVFVPLCSGGAICIPAGKEILMDAETLINWIEKFRVQLIHCVPSLFRLLSFQSDILTNDFFKELKYVLLSGEPIHPSDLVQWYEIFDERIQLVNLWGISEATLAKTCHFIRKSDIHRERIPVGQPITGTRTVILNKGMNPCGEFLKGEIYIITPFGTLGYCNDPDLTGDRFLPNPFIENPGVRMHKTGDLGRFLPDGNIDLLGRNDHQVKIRGIRLELGEIESILIRHPLVKEAVVIKKELPNDNELLCAYITGIEKTPIAEESFPGNLKEYLQAKLPGYMVPTEITRIEKIPRNPNGKIDCKKLPDLSQDGREYFIPPRNQVEEKILELWSEILGIEMIGINQNFFELGGTSLKVMSLITKIHRKFDIRISLGEIFNHATIEEQARIIGRAKQKTYIPISIAQEKEYYSLSSAQTRMFVSQQLEKESTAYNVSTTVIIKGPIEKEQLEEIFRKLIMRHESLRTSFQFIDGKPMQKIHPQVEFTIEYSEAEGLGEQSPYPEIKDRSPELPLTVDDRINHFIKPFDLSQAPLIRVGLIKTNEQEHILMVDLHHSITDYTSLNILIEEFLALYDGEELPTLRIQYKDFSEWQNSEKQEDILKNQEAYWLRVFEEEVPGLNLPIDFERTNVRSSKSGRITFIIENEVTEKVKGLIAEEEVTMYIMLLSIYNILLSKLSGKTDIVIGTFVEGRNDVELRQIVGMFVNTLALRNYPEREKTFKEFLQEVKKRTLEALDNQDYQYEDLVKKLRLRRPFGKTSLFDAAFDLKSMEIKRNNNNGLKFLPYGPKVGQNQFDLILLVTEVNGKIDMSLIYSTALFKRSTAEKYTKRYAEILKQVVENKTIRLGDIRISHDLSVSKSASFKEDDSDFGF